MAWYDPTTWGTAGRVVGGVATMGGSELFGQNGYGNQIFNDPGQDQERRRRELLYGQAGAAGDFADQAQQSYNAYGQRAGQGLDALQAMAMGGNSVAAEQLRQGLQQMYGQQASMAASAAPRNAGMAARTAAIGMQRAGTAMNGQAAMAGLQERNDAWGRYAQLIQGLRQQDLQASLGGRQAAIGGYGAGQAGAPDKSWLEKYGPAVVGGLSAAGKMA